MRVLIIEDEDSLRNQLEKRLQEERFAVDPCAKGEDGLFMGSEYPYDVAIIDVGLPGISGLDVIRALRQKKIKYPIIILTARGRWQEKVEGLEAGADDYLVKPFHIEELIARLKALVRRSAGQTQAEMSFGPIVLNNSSQEVRVDGKYVELTAYEYKVLEYLMLKHGQVVSKTDLTEHIYAQDFDRDSNVIEVFVGRLRRKLDPEDTIKPIETLRGRGYRFTLDPN